MINHRRKEEEKMDHYEVKQTMYAKDNSHHSLFQEVSWKDANDTENHQDIVILALNKIEYKLKIKFSSIVKFYVKNHSTENLSIYEKVKRITKKHFWYRINTNGQKSCKKVFDIPFWGKLKVLPPILHSSKYI